MTTRCAFAAVLWLAVQDPVAGDRVVRGIEAYRAGRFASALADFQQELEQRGAAAPVELRIDVAMAALRLLRTGDAEAALRPVADGPAPAMVPFLLGLAAMQRAERAAAAASLADAEPLAWPMAVRACGEAVRWFVVAAERGAAWPPALRNAERALRRQQEFARQQAAAGAAQAQREEVQPEPVPPPPSPNAEREQAVPDLQVAPLTQAQVADLQRVLLQREQQKRRQRSATQRAAAVAGERDW